MISLEHPFVKMTLSFCSDMVELSKPLAKIGINYLSYTRVYKDGSRIALSTVPKILEDHFSQKRYLTCENEKHPDKHKAGEVIVWSTLPDQSLYQNARAMGACDGIYLFDQKNNEFIDSFGFASSTPNSAILNSYFTNLDLLKKFTECFNQEAHHILNKMNTNKIILPFNKEARIFTYCREELETILTFKSQIRLTARQKECAYFLLQGKSAKMIARELNLSYRTIETYISDLKRRLECKNKSELIVRLIYLYNIKIK